MKQAFPFSKMVFTTLAALIIFANYGCSSKNKAQDAVFTQAAQTAIPRKTSVAATQQVVIAASQTAEKAFIKSAYPWVDTPQAEATEEEVATSQPSSTPDVSNAPQPGSTLPATATPQQNTPPALGSEAVCIPSSNPPQTGKVLDILDGDTIKVMIDGKTYIVRYIGVDAPEFIKSKEYFGTEARLKNSDLVYAKDITLYKDSSETDPSGRLLRYVKIGDIFVNFDLVSNGFSKAAPESPNSACDAIFQSAQDQASAAKLGLWGNK